MNDKFKEFHINPKGTWLKVTDLIKDNKLEDHVHVIEYAAYDQLKQDLEACIEALEFYSGRSIWKDKSEWDGCKFLTFDKFGALDEDISGPQIAKSTISKLKYKKEKI